jgi:rfaE bifunctional protein nucleotidyltransferase chain/domain
MLKIESIELYTSKKILSFESCAKKIAELKKQGKTVGLCHGGFDLTHPGHVKHFESAKSFSDILVVSITSDRFVSARKGSGRPIYTDKLRAFMAASIYCVNYVVITDFKLGVDVINGLKPTYYIKGADNINKTTPGITAEKEAIQKIGGEMRCTTEPPMSTTKIIDYIKNELDVKNVLLVIDRDGTLIKNDDFFGKSKDWKKELIINDNVFNFLYYIQTKQKTTMIVVTNQTGVARRYFDCKRVEEINAYINNELMTKKNIKIANWQYCPDADAAYAKAHPELNIDPKYAKDTTRRKPGIAMVMDALKSINKDIAEFTQIVVIGDRDEDKGLAENLKAVFIDVRNKDYNRLMKEFESAQK